MIIAIAGPYSADTESERRANLAAMNDAAAMILELGHIPVIGVNAALPVVERSNIANKYEAIMKISMAVINNCEAILMTGSSPGADMEKELILSKGLPVYYSINEIPK